MSAKPSRPSLLACAPEPLLGEAVTLSVRIRCPGFAHRIRGGGPCDQSCLVCDPEDDGFIDVLLTQVESETLHRAAHGLPIDARFAPRLLKLGLLEDLGSCRIPTIAGYAVIAELPFVWS